MKRGPDSPTDDVWSGSYLSHATLPIFTSTIFTRISELSMNVKCEDSTGGLRAASPTCNFDVKLRYADKENVFRTGSFFASGEYSTTYDITGGIDDFNSASGTFKAVFDSNDPEWYTNIEVDMCFEYPEIGDAVKCLDDTDGEGVPDTYIYRLTSSSKIQHYPSKAIAFSWGDKWHVDTKTIDCTGMTIGDDVAMKPSGLVDGKTVFCFDDTVAAVRSGYYRWVGFELREYPSGEIATSWDSKWTTAERINCTGLSIGENLPLKPSYPDGESIQCINNTDGSWKATRVYRLVNGSIRRYPDANTAYSYGPSWHLDIKQIDCTGIPIGRPMTMRPTGVEEGDAVKCIPDSDLSKNPHKFYRYTDAGLRHYPSPTIAFSWSSLWHMNYKSIDCTGIPHIEDMPLKLQK